jgi:hypothetical protein
MTYPRKLTRLSFRFLSKMLGHARAAVNNVL